MVRRARLKKTNVSILILTLNEEENIQQCLDSVSWSNDIVVLDSGSLDKTVLLAKKKGARVITRSFDNWASHQNWAMKKIKFKNPWVFYLDADERMMSELKEEILSIAADPARPEKTFFCGRRNYFFGKWIRHSFPPGHILRFFQPPFVRFERLVNPVAVIQGPHGYLKNYFDHYNFSKGLEEWFAKHNQYSTAEALEGAKGGVAGFTLRPLLALDAVLKRLKIKTISNRLPFKPLIKFFWVYIVKRGFLDGREGFIYCVLQSIYEYMIVLKSREIELRNKGLKP